MQKYVEHAAYLEALVGHFIHHFLHHLDLDLLAKLSQVSLLLGRSGRGCHIYP
jgi:hypothetical protein